MTTTFTLGPQYNISGVTVRATAKALSASNIASLSGLATTVDGVLLNTDGFRVLLTGQTTTSQNGFWEVHSGAWTRPLDFYTGFRAASKFTFIEKGTIYADTGWICATDFPNDIIDTNSLAFSQFTGSNFALAAVGSSPNSNAATFSTGTLTLQPADGTNPGVLTAGTQTIGGAKTFSSTIAASNLSGTNTGDITLTAVGSSPSANGASLSSQALTLQPADATHPGLVTTGTQTLAGAKTLPNALTLSTSSSPAIIMPNYNGDYIWTTTWNSAVSGMYMDNGNSILHFDLFGVGDAGLLDHFGNFTVKGNIKLGPTGYFRQPHYFDGSGTTGNQTLNYSLGKGAFAAGTSTVTIGNNYVDATTFVTAVLETNDATAQIKNITKTTGSFTINLVSATTGTTVFMWSTIQSA